MCKGLSISSDVATDNLAHLTPGYVGADLSSLVREAAMCAVNRIFSHVKPELYSESNASNKPATFHLGSEESSQAATPLSSREYAKKRFITSTFKLNIEQVYEPCLKMNKNHSS